MDKQLTQTTRPDGLLVGRTYDSAGKLDLITTPTGNVDFDYFGLTPCPTCAPGRLQKITDPSGVVLEHAYDGPLLKTLTWSGAIAGSVTFGHDPSFRVTSETVTVGATASPVAFGYDNDDILICASPSTCSPAGTDALKLTLNAGNGLVTGSTHGLVTDTLTYNPFGELASYTGKVGASNVFSEVVDTVANPRDALGRIVQRVETNGGASVTWRYTYDLRGRLIGVQKDGSAYEQYAYDANGNRTLLTTPTGTAAGVYDAQDRLLSYGSTTYTYTANGELRTKTDSSGTTTYTYDVRGNLVRVDLPGGDVIEYVVDGQDRRVGKKKNGVLVQAWLYRNHLNPVAELDGAGNLVSRFVYGSRSNVPEYLVRGGAAYRVLADHLGSPRAVVDVATGAVAWRADFDAWGNRNLTAGTTDWIPFGFAGGMFDAETGLVRFGARDYDALVGRWLTRDPILFIGRQANLYAYVDNDPVSWTDPSGLTVYLCSRIAELFGNKDKDIALGVRHWWLWNSGSGFEAGVGPDPSGWGGIGPGLLRSTRLDPHAGAHNETGSWKDVRCAPVEAANEACVDSFIDPSQYGKSLGPWIPFANDCGAFVFDVLEACHPQGPGWVWQSSYGF